MSGRGEGENGGEEPQRARAGAWVGRPPAAGARERGADGGRVVPRTPLGRFSERLAYRPSSARAAVAGMSGVRPLRSS